MAFLRFFIIVLFIVLINPANSKNQQDFSRDLWNPTYNAQRLNYCSLDGKQCGLSLAHCYCKVLGYEKANKAIIDYNVGLTNFFLSKAQCQGWSCNGFKLITCKSRFHHTPPKAYYYRQQRFAFPRFGHFRIDWCYENGKGCGQRAAYSFCRRMGYMRAIEYGKEERTGATKAIGNQRLCFGRQCRSFSYITCYR